MKRDYLLFLLEHGQCLRTSPLLQQHKRIAGSPSVKRALSVAPVDGDRGGAALQEMQCDAADLGFFEDARGLNAAVDVTQSDQLVLQFCEIYGTAQPQDGAGELATQMTGAAETGAAKTGCKETAATQPCAAAAAGKVAYARRNRLGHSYAKRKSGQNRNTISSPAGSALQTGTTPVKNRQDVQEVIMNTFKRQSDQHGGHGREAERVSATAACLRPILRCLCAGGGAIARRDAA
jgi:hypothetical protein